MTERASPRLAFLHEDPHQWGGGEAVLERLSRLAALGMPVDLALLFGSSRPLLSGAWSHFARVGRFDFPHRLRWPEAGALVRNRRALGRWLRQGAVQACVAMTFATAFRTALATAGTATPLAWMCNFSVKTQEGWRSMMRSLALRALALSGALAICPSLAARDELAALGYPLGRMRIIANGVDLARFDRARMSDGERREFRERHGFPAAELVALHVARLDPVKNHDVLFRAVAEAGRRGVRIALVCLGDTSAGHAGYAAGLPARAAELGIGDRVLFAGRQENVPAWLAAADVAVLSSHTEMAALVLPEAAAAGLPLLASRVGSAPELVVPGRTGYMFEPDDMETCARHLIALAASEAHRRKLGAAARQLAERAFDARQVDRQWQALFAELLELPAPGETAT